MSIEKPPSGSYKVLQVYRTFFPDTQGGVEEVLRQIAKNTLKNGIQMRILVPSPTIKKSEHIIVDGLDVYRVPELCEIASCNFYKRGFSVFKELVEWADIIHYHYPWPFQDLLHFLIAEKHNKKLVVTYHSDIIRQKAMLRLYKPLQKKFLAAADIIVATSPVYKESSKLLREHSDKVTVIPLGLDENTLPGLSSSHIDHWRNRVGEGFFFFVGMLRYYKGLHILLDAAAKSNLKVVVAGEGLEFDSLKKQKVQMGLDNVELLGRVSDEDKAALFSLCTAVVLPSFLRSEAFGVMLLEGMYISKPLITTDIDTGVNYVNEKGVTGLSVKAQSSDALAEAMLQIDSDPAMAGQMGKASRRRYEELFTGKHLGDAYTNVYQKLMK